MSSPGVAGKGGDASRPDAGRPDHRLPRSCRLTSRQQFVEVYRNGRRVGSSSFVLFGRASRCDQCRLGITVTRKTGGAVRRNRVKRVLRDIFRRHRADLQPPLDLVINARPQILEARTEALEREFLGAFHRLVRRMGR